MAPPSAPRVIELTIAELGARGDGIGTHDGAKVFVPLTLPGERVRVEIEAKRPGGFAGRAIAWLDRSAARREPPCPHFGRCGGCALQHLTDGAYERWKTDRIATALARARVPAPAMAPLMRTAPAGRRRAELAARRQGKHWTIGFHGRDGKTIVALSSCPVLRPELVGLLRPLADLLGHLTPRQRSVDIAGLSAESGLDLLLTLPAPPDLVARETLARFAETHDLARIAWRPTAAAEPEIIAARRPVTVRFADTAVMPPPGAFLQASLEGEAAIVACVLGAVGQVQRIADLYAGAGTLTFPLSAAAPVHAVEGDGALAASLAQAARRSGLGSRITVETRDLVRRPLLKAELSRFDVVVFDPPHAGAAAQVPEIARARPKLVVAVSCNPVTFARDARVLVEAGYRLEQLWPIDQFLWSPEVELVGVLRRS